MKKILVETSARHIHLTEEAFEALCGKGAKLEVKKMLSQPGQFASNTKLDIVGPKHTIAGVSILGPLRDHNQVEVSATDARTLGADAPIRESGDIKGSAPIIIVNPLNGNKLELKEGLIVAKRHGQKEDKIVKLLEADERFYRAVALMTLITEIKKQFEEFNKVMRDSKGEKTPQSNFIEQDLNKLTSLIGLVRQQATCHG